jgi:hypothetical protein
MEPWMWAIVGVVPVVAVGTAYASGAFSTQNAKLDKALGPYYSSSKFVNDPEAMKSEIERERTQFTGDDDRPYQASAGKRKHKKTKKAKKGSKKTIRRK